MYLQFFLVGGVRVLAGVAAFSMLYVDLIFFEGLFWLLCMCWFCRVVCSWYLNNNNYMGV